MPRVNPAGLTSRGCPSAHAPTITEEGQASEVKG